MEEKLKSYVDYYFRFDQREDIDEVKAEILDNLIDRFEEYKAKYQDEDKAYVEAIKSMGDFKQDEEIIEDPLLVDTGLLVSLVTAIFALIGVLFNNVLGLVMLTVSISMFVASSYVLVGKAKVFIEEEKDIERSKYHLQKIFSYMKASFSFWSITLSLLGAKLIYTVFLSLTFLGNMNNGSSIEDIKILLILSFIVFVILLVAFLIFSRIIYARLMHQYYLMTGDKDVESKVHKGLAFIKDSSPGEKEELKGIVHRLLGGKYFIRIYLSAFWVFALPFGMEISTTSWSNWTMEHGNYFLFVFMSPDFGYSFFRVFLGLISLGIFLMLGFSYIWKTISDKMLIFSTYGLILIYIFCAIMAEIEVFKYSIQGSVFGYLVLIGLFTLVIFALRMLFLPNRSE